MERRSHRTSWVTLAVATGVSVGGCTLKEQEPPPLAGPSELGVSLSMSATPDVLTQDGFSQSQVAVIARNADSAPISSFGLRVETLVNGALIDIGRLSSKNVQTGSDGRAAVTFTAPRGAESGNSERDEILVTIRMTPIGTDYSTAIGRTIEILLIPQGRIEAPPGTPFASFTFDPKTATEGQAVQFDASASRDCAPTQTLDDCKASGGSGKLVSYEWDFGDGGFARGVTASHQYNSLGSYIVTLTVTNARGIKGTTTAFIQVGAGTGPTADFSASPTGGAGVGEPIFFNASASKAAPGRTLVGFDWTFGDGGSGSGMTVTRTYSRAGSFSVTLTVTDDLGKTATKSTTVTIGAGQSPTADLVFSPAAPRINTDAFFNAGTTTAPPGRSIRSYEWNFGDGQTAAGVTVVHQFGQPGSYAVVLTVVDSAGTRAAKTGSVSVQP